MSMQHVQCVMIDSIYLSLVLLFLVATGGMEHLTPSGILLYAVRYDRYSIYLSLVLLFLVLAVWNILPSGILL